MKFPSRNTIHVLKIWLITPVEISNLSATSFKKCTTCNKMERSVKKNKILNISGNFKTEYLAEISPELQGHIESITILVC